MQNTTSLTCISCRLSFKDAEEQKNHYKSDFHRFNLKRKVANLPPVDENQFGKKVQNLRDQEKNSENAQSFFCEVCSKSYSSTNSYSDHLKSKKHLENSKSNPELKNPTITSKPKKPTQDEIDAIEKQREDLLQKKESIIQNIQKQTSEDKNKMEVDDVDDERELTEEEIRQLEDKEIEDRIKNARFFEPEECMFCCEKANSFRKNLEHMEKIHGLFFPDKEYITDMKGFVKYLADKVSVGNICLYCNGKGKSFHSLEAVQAHMNTLNHCKLHYDDNEEEYEDFYDFSKDYEHIEKQEDEESVGIKVKPIFTLHDNGFELILENGKVLGHRSLAKYYKQKYSANPMQNEYIKAHRLLFEYKALGWIGDKAPPTKLELALRKEQKKDRANFHKFQNRSNLSIGIKHNNQKHYRDQTGMIQ